MRKLVALYRKPDDVEAFFEHYHNVHLPLVAKLPGLLKTEIMKVETMLAGEESYFLVGEIYFADAASFDAARASVENAAVAADSLAFAPGLTTVMVGDIMDIGS